MVNVLFDPGYSSCFLGVSESVEFIYGAFIEQPLNLKQKKFQFSILFPKIKTLLKKNLSFYLGCLLWAVYLKNIKDGMIEDNPCIGQEFDEEDSLEEVNYLIGFINETLEKDAKYYLNLKFEKDEKYIKILENYAEFIKLNKGFIKLEKTEEILLPSSLKNPDETGLSKIKEKIDETISKKDLTLLFDVYDLILD